MTTTRSNLVMLIGGMFLWCNSLTHVSLILILDLLLQSCNLRLDLLLVVTIILAVLGTFPVGVGPMWGKWRLRKFLTALPACQVLAAMQAAVCIVVSRAEGDAWGEWISIRARGTTWAIHLVLWVFVTSLVVLSLSKVFEVLCLATDTLLFFFDKS